MAFEGNQVVGKNMFASEKTGIRHRKLSTNKMRDMELVNLKKERGGLRLEQSEEESFVLKVGLEQGRLEKIDAAKVDQEIDDNKSKTAMLEKSSTLKEGLVELKDNMLMEGVEGSTEVVKDEFNFISKVDDDLAIQNSLDGVRKEKCDWEAELAKFKNINLMKEELKIENENLENLRREVEKTKIGKMSRKIKLRAVVVEALIDQKGRMSKYNINAEVERVNPDTKGDVVEVSLSGTEQAVDKMDQLLRDLTSTCLVIPLKECRRSVVSACEGSLLEQIRRMADAAVGFKDGMFYIFGAEKERLEAEAVIKQELKLCTSSSWRRWSFLRPKKSTFS